MAEVNGETVRIIGACVTALGVVGGGIKWMVSTRDQRQRMIDESVKRHTAALESKAVRLEGRVALLVSGYTILLGEVARHAPDSPALRQAQRIFDLAFKIPGDTPDAHADLLDALHEKTKAPGEP